MTDASYSSYTSQQHDAIKRYEAAVTQRFREHPRRLIHSLSVGHCAEHIACAYDIYPYKARVAGILHDWDKILLPAEQIARAQACGVDLGVDCELVAPLLHGITAVYDLEKIFPELDRDVLQAIERHTTGSDEMTPLDSVVFVADVIEKQRQADEALEHIRSHVGLVSLDDLFFMSFAYGLVRVIKARRYLYPPSLSIYNAFVMKAKDARYKAEPSD